MEGVLQEKGYSVMVCDCRSDPERECRAVRFLLEKRVDGLINMPIGAGAHLEPGAGKGAAGAPARPPAAPARRPGELRAERQTRALPALPRAACSRQDTGRSASSWGRRTSSPRSCASRATGKRSRNYGVAPCENLIAYSDYTVQGGYRQICRLLEENKDMTAVFVTNYEMTLGALIALNERGVRIPEELSIIGFDNLDLSRVANPPLTIVRPAARGDRAAGGAAHAGSAFGRETARRSP